MPVPSMSVFSCSCQVSPPSAVCMIFPNSPTIQPCSGSVNLMSYKMGSAAARLSPPERSASIATFRARQVLPPSTVEVRIERSPTAQA